jgi:hypothetical protein
MFKRISNAAKFNGAPVRALLLLGALALGVAACSPASSTDTTSSADAPTEGQPTSAPQAEAPTAPAAGLDVLSMNACAMFPGEEVANALNATLSDPANTGKGSGGPDCTYGLLTDGAGTVGTQLYFINLVDPELFDLSLGALADAPPIEGLGDEAYSGTRVGTETFEIMIRNAGGVSIDVLGSDAGLVRKLAEYVLAQL